MKKASQPLQLSAFPKPLHLDLQSKVEKSSSEPSRAWEGISAHFPGTEPGETSIFLQKAWIQGEARP